MYYIDGIFENIALFKCSPKNKIALFKKFETECPASEKGKLLARRRVGTKSTKPRGLTLRSSHSDVDVDHLTDRHGRISVHQLHCFQSKAHALVISVTCTLHPPPNNFTFLQAANNIT